MIFVAYIEFIIIIFGLAIFLTLIRHLKNRIRTEKMKHKSVYYVKIEQEKTSQEKGSEIKSEEHQD